MYESQESPIVEKIQISLTVNDRFITTQGILFSSLMPKPRTVIELNDLPNELPIEPGKSYDFKLDNGNEIQAKCVSNTSRTIDSDSNSKSVFIPQGGCWTLMKTKEPLNSVAVRVVNFSNFISSEYDTLKHVQNGKSLSSTVPTIHLNVEKWAIKVTTVPKLNEILEDIRKSDGNVVTHTCNVSRSDNSTFSIHTVRDLLHKLRLFLSFARGRFCGLTDIVGRNGSGETIWRELGCPKVDPWNDTQSWFDVVQGPILAVVFPGFYKCMSKVPIGNRIELGLHWYLLANRGIGFLEPDLVLAQTALELLSCVILKKNKKNHEKTGEFIRSALDKLPVSVEVPNDLQFMYDFANKQKFEHGPHALTEIRNDMVHCQTNHDGIPTRLLFDAKMLSLWYVELMLLKLSGYNGMYSNRITRDWVGEVETVPWG